MPLFQCYIKKSHKNEWGVQISVGHYCFLIVTNMTCYQKKLFFKNVGYQYQSNNSIINLPSYFCGY
jgi:hypothetical protein